MALLRLREVSFHVGTTILLDKASFSVEKNERICLIGRNGAGKSTLLRIIEGLVQADDGIIEKQQGMRIAALSQELPLTDKGSVFDVVSAGLGETGHLLAQYHEVSHQLAEQVNDALYKKLDDLQQKIEAVDGWTFDQKVSSVISKMNLDESQEFSELSGGLKRRVKLAAALVTEPDLLLLDEPTNHLDIEAIDWLENFLIDQKITLLFITHDRMFLRKLATKIIELDRGMLSEWPGDYDTYLRRKAEALDAEEKQNALFDKKLAQEETWIRQGIKARRTRNEGRVRALKDLRQQRSQRRERQGTANMTLQQAERSGKLVIEAEHISFSYEGQKIVDDFSTTIMRGDKIGIIGPNGVGKSTLLKLLLGELQPDSGTIKHGTSLEVLYFDQLRGQLNESLSVIDNISEGRESISVNGQQKHVIGYLQDFLFTPDRARSPVSMLSGGEKNRLLLAKLFSKPCNIMVLDEPTNDLDLETLDLLEELLLQFDGTMLLVSHDRDFLDRTVTSTIVFEGNAKLNEYVGGYQDWLRQRETNDVVSQPENSVEKSKQKPATQKSKLSYKDARELEQLPAKIEKLEQQITALQEKMSGADYFKTGADEIADDKAQLAEYEQKLETAFEKWQELEAQLE